MKMKDFSLNNRKTSAYFPAIEQFIKITGIFPLILTDNELHKIPPSSPKSQIVNTMQILPFLIS